MSESREIASAFIRPAFAADDTAPLARPATVVDVSDQTIGLRVRPDVDVTPNQVVELTVGDTWRRGRVVWSRNGVRDAVIAYVELTEPAP